MLKWFRGRPEARRERIEPVIKPVASMLTNPEPWFSDWAAGAPLGAAPAAFGPPVNEQIAMTVPAVLRAVAIYSGIIASLPLKVYRDRKAEADGDYAGREEVIGHRYSSFFNSAPFPMRPLTSFMWREAWESDTLLWGNHYSAIRYNAAGRIMGFEPAKPYSEVYRLTSGPRAGQNAYSLTFHDGHTEILPQDEVLHICGIGFDGLRGASRIRHYAKNAVSLARLFEEQTGRMHENAARPTGVVTLPPNISPDGVKRMTESFRQRYAGRENAGTPIFLDQGSTFTPVTISLEDLETLKSRSFQIAEIARIFGIPLHFLAESANASSWGSGIEQLTIGWMITGLESELSRIESELNLKLFAGTSEYVRFDRDELRAMDVLTAARAAQVEIQSGTLTLNEQRRRKHRKPYDEFGDEPLVNATMVPLRIAIERAQQGIAAPAGQPQQDPNNDGGDNASGDAGPQ